MYIKKEPDTKINNYGISFFGVLTIVFIVLKLLNKITWSWLWVLSPLWIGAIIDLSVIFIVIAVMRKL